MECFPDTLAISDTIPTRTVATRDTDRIGRTIENPVLKSLDESSTVNFLLQVKGTTTMTITTGPTRKLVKAIAAKQRIADGCPGEVCILTQITAVETHPPHYQNVRTRKVVIMVPV